jgi:hypothetical protein
MASHLLHAFKLAQLPLRCPLPHCRARLGLQASLMVSRSSSSRRSSSRSSRNSMFQMPSGSYLSSCSDSYQIIETCILLLVTACCCWCDDLQLMEQQVPGSKAFAAQVS